MYAELSKLLDRGHFQIRKWATNSPELLKMIPKEARAPTTTEEEESSLLLSEETSSLGIRWILQRISLFLDIIVIWQFIMMIQKLP